MIAPFASREHYHELLSIVDNYVIVEIAPATKREEQGKGKGWWREEEEGMGSVPVSYGGVGSEGGNIA